MRDAGRYFVPMAGLMVRGGVVEMVVEMIVVVVGH